MEVDAWVIRFSVYLGIVTDISFRVVSYNLCILFEGNTFCTYSYQYYTHFMSLGCSMLINDTFRMRNVRITPFIAGRQLNQLRVPNRNIAGTWRFKAEVPPMCFFVLFMLFVLQNNLLDKTLGAYSTSFRLVQGGYSEAQKA